MNALQRSFHRWFHPKNHLWFQASSVTPSTSTATPFVFPLSKTVGEDNNNNKDDNNNGKNKMNNNSGVNMSHTVKSTNDIRKSHNFHHYNNFDKNNHSNNHNNYNHNKWNVLVEIGFTQRGMEDIGDVTVIRPTITNNMNNNNNNNNTTSKKIEPQTTLTSTSYYEMDDKNATTILNKKEEEENHDETKLLFVQPGDYLVEIEWDGHSITSADELYHTVWNNFSGTSQIISPFSGFIMEINTRPSPPQLWFDEDTVLVKLLTTQKEWEHVTSSLSLASSLTRTRQNDKLVKEPEYIRIIQSQPRGLFASMEKQ